MESENTLVKVQNETILHCPVCNHDFVHLIKAVVMNDDKKLKTILSFECENLHHFSLVLYNHKGATELVDLIK